MNTLQDEIKTLVNKYPVENKEIFKIELERLVLLAEREQMIKDQDSTMEILRKPPTLPGDKRYKKRNYEKN